jgi:hypothetical protein
MKNLNSALAPKVILKGISMLMLVCLATLGIAYFVSNPIGGTTSQIPSETTANYKVVEDIGGRSYPPPVSRVNYDLGANRLPVETFAFCLNSSKDIGGKSTTGEFYTISNFEIGGTRSVGEIAFYRNKGSDIGSKSSNGGLLDLALIDLPIGGGKLPPGEFKLST